MKKKSASKTKGIQNLVVQEAPQSPGAEQFRILRANINFSSKEPIRSLAIVSAESGEGKSIAAANLSAAFAQEGKSVLLVDADLRKPSLHYTFNLNNDYGLSTVLSQNSTIEKAIKPSGIHGLEVLTSGPVPSNPTDLLAATVDQLTELLKPKYDMIIFDSPPLLSTADGQILANNCEGTILVISSGKTQMQKAAVAVEAIKSSNGRLLGAVLNRFPFTKTDPSYRTHSAAQQNTRQLKERNANESADPQFNE